MKISIDLKREGKWLLACNFLTIAINGMAIARYDTPWIELITQIGWTTLLATALYLSLIPLRGLVNYIKINCFK